MPKLEYFIVAESVSIDQTTNLVSFFNVVEEVRPGRFPAVIRFVAVSSWNAEPEDAEREFQVSLWINQAGDEPRKFDANVKMTSLRHRVVMRFVDFEIDKPGDLHCEVRLNGEHMAQHLITVPPPKALSAVQA